VNRVPLCFPVASVEIFFVYLLQAGILGNGMENIFMVEVDSPLSDIGIADEKLDNLDTLLNADIRVNKPRYYSP